ncbi:MAG: GNAT family N-acetyltransferase [Chloroflexota bacterium]
MPARIGTGRLVLRGWTEADAAWHRVLVTERAQPPDDPASYSATVCVEQRRRTATQGFGLYVVEVRAGPGPIGYCGLIVGRSTLAEPELAYELLHRAQGQGYATEAARAVVAAAAGAGISRLWATVGPWNGPSLRVLDKLGFRRDRVEGAGADEVIWARLELRPTPRADARPGSAREG